MNKEISSKSSSNAISIIRVSSRNQEANSSYEIQKRTIDAHLEKQHLFLVKEFKFSESAKDSTQRKKYHMAMDYALKHKTKHIVFYMADRETRNMVDLESSEYLIKKGHIAIHYAHEGKIIDEFSPSSEFLARDINGVLNKQFSRVLGEKVSSALKNKFLNGNFSSGRPPLGYKHFRPVDENGEEIKRATTILIIDPNEKNVQQVQREFELRAQGFSFEEIRDKIISEGFISPEKVKKYHKNNIVWRLKNVSYYGFVKHKGEEGIGFHPLIIPRHILDAVALINRDRNKAVVTTQNDAIFSGWLKCANHECGCQITFEKRKGIYSLYHCSNSKKIHNTLKGMYVREEEIWRQLESAVTLLRPTNEMAKDIADAMNDKIRAIIQKAKAKIKTFEAALAGLDKSCNSFLEMSKNGAISEVEYKKQAKRIEDERNDLLQEIKKTQRVIDAQNYKTTDSILELSSKSLDLWQAAPRFERLAFLNRIIREPVLDGKTIKYGLKQPFLLLANGMQESRIE